MGHLYFLYIPKKPDIIASCILLRFILTHFLTEIAEISPEFFTDRSFIIVSVLWHNYIK